MKPELKPLNNCNETRNETLKLKPYTKPERNPK